MIHLEVLILLLLSSSSASVETLALRSSPRAGCPAPDLRETRDVGGAVPLAVLGETNVVLDGTCGGGADGDGAAGAGESSGNGSSGSRTRTFFFFLPPLGSFVCVRVGVGCPRC